MCVIIVKPAGVDLPDSIIFNACWDTNPDGFGMAYSDGNSVTIDKGYMDPDLAYEAMMGTKKEWSCIYHFRIATSGAVDAGACHPYPLSSMDDDLRKLEVYNSTSVLAHNGIVGKGHGLLNDTQVMVKALAEKAQSDGSAFNIAKFLKAEAKRTHSRFVYLTNTGDYVLTGDWTERQGLFFSNLLWTWAVRADMTGQAEEDYYASVEAGIVPFCPACGSDNTVAHLNSALALCECYDCQTVFDGMTGDMYELYKTIRRY